MHLLCFKRWNLRYLPGQDNPLPCIMVLYVGKGSEREQWWFLSSHPTFKRLPVSPATATPTGFYSPRFWGFIFPTLEPWAAWSVSLPSCSSWFICTWMWEHLVHQPLPCHASSRPQLPVSAPPTSLDEYFFFNSFIVRLPYSLIFWQFWLFFFFNWLLPFFLVVQGSKMHLPTVPSCPGALSM